jgi:hypothetical protein
MNNGQQNPTNAQNQSEVDVAPVPYQMLTLQQQAWVDYNVLQGVMLESDGEMSKMSVREFADKVGVNRTTCYAWTKAIPNFWDLVNMRRKEMFKGARTAKVWNAVFLAATVKLNPQAQAIWLANADDKFRMPNQTVTHEAGGGLMDVLEIARKRKLQVDAQNTVEAEVVERPAEQPSVGN